MDQHWRRLIKRKGIYDKAFRGLFSAQQKLKSMRKQVLKIKTSIMLITWSRIAGAFILLFFVTPLSVLFYIIYIWCVISDIIDGPLARKTNTASDFGALLDSIADLALIISMLIVFIPILPFEVWMLFLIALVIAIRLLSMAIGLKKYRTITLLHTYSSKASALIMASFPVLYITIGMTPMFLIIFASAFLAAVDELQINIKSDVLVRDTPGLFFKSRKS